MESLRVVGDHAIFEVSRRFILLSFLVFAHLSQNILMETILKIILFINYNSITELKNKMNE